MSIMTKHGGKNMSSGTDGPTLRSQACHLGAKWPRTSCLSTLSNSSSICNLGILASLEADWLVSTSQIWLAFVNKALLGHSHDHSFTYCLKLLLLLRQGWVVWTETIGLQNVKYLLFGLLQKTFVNHNSQRVDGLK